MEGTSVPPSISKSVPTGRDEALRNPDETQPSALRSSLTLLSPPSLPGKGKPIRKVGFLLNPQQGELEMVPASTGPSEWLATSGSPLREAKSPLWRSQELETFRELTLRCGENFARVASELGYEVVPQAPPSTPESATLNRMGAVGEGGVSGLSIFTEGADERSQGEMSFLTPDLCSSTVNPVECRETAGGNFFPRFLPIEQHFKPLGHFGKLRQSLLSYDAEYECNDDVGKYPNPAPAQLMSSNPLWRGSKNESASDCSVSVADEIATVPFITLPLNEMIMTVEGNISLGSQRFSSSSTFQTSRAVSTPREITVHDIFTSPCVGDHLSTAYTMRQSNSSVNEYSHTRNESRSEFDPLSAVNPIMLFENYGDSEYGREDEQNISSRNWSPNRDFGRNHAPQSMSPNPHPEDSLPDVHQTSMTQRNPFFSRNGDRGITTLLSQNHTITPLTPSLNEPLSVSSASRPHIC
ncbi:unnamed protein product [Phytomonas sp. Hart1]|nr:unnamed protein product [Phytomonas sp. Hart1]|eukprot:CCW67400.1 unnamed protein product [Phytomonas sp. isolate Hart1]